MRTSKHIRHTLLLSSVIGASAIAPNALAQSGQVVLDNIVVTAQKREQSLQDVPVAIDVVTAETFQTRQIDAIGEIAAMMPGFEFARAPSDSPGVTFRGIGTQAGNVAFDNSIGMFVDGAFLGNVRLYGQTLFDIERMELIKGTQSTLLGKNTSLGAVSVVNRRPGEDFEGYVQAGLELENGGGFGQGAINIPLSDKMAMRIAGRYSDLDGWITNVTTGNEVPADRDLGLRTSLSYQANDKLDVLVSYQYTGNRRHGTANQMTAPGLSALGLGAGPDLGESDFDDTKASFSSDPRLKDGEDYTNLKAHMAIGTINYDFGNLVLTSVTSGAWFDFTNNLDFDFDNKDATVLARSEDYSQYSQELRLASPTGETVEYLMGAYFFHSSWDMVQDNDYGIPDFPPDATAGQLFNGAFTNTFRQKTDAYSAFGQVTYNVTDVLRFNVGARFTHERKKVWMGRTNRAPFTLWNTVIQAPFPYQQLNTVKDDLFSGSVSVQYDVNPDTMLYASASRGGKSGGYGEFNTIPLDPVLGTGNPNVDGRVGNERANSYEIGMKSALADNRVRLNVALFYTDVFGLQQLLFSPAGLFVSSNDRARSKGIDGALSWQVSENFRLDLAGAYADAKELDTGFRLGQSPKFSGSARAQWDQPIGEDLLLSLSSTVQYRSSKYNQPTEGLKTGDFTTLAVSARLSSESSRWHVSVIGENLTNELGADFGFAGPDPFVERFDTTAPLRSIKLSAGIDF